MQNRSNAHGWLSSAHFYILIPSPIALLETIDNKRLAFSMMRKQFVFLAKILTSCFLFLNLHFLHIAFSVKFVEDDEDNHFIFSR